MENPIATRVLHCMVNGKPEQVTVNIGRPREDDGSFRCEYEIVFQGEHSKHAICGVDGIQAIQLVMFMVGSTLSSLAGASNWTCNGEWGTGFPTTQTKVDKKEMAQPLGSVASAFSHRPQNLCRRLKPTRESSLISLPSTPVLG